MEQKTKLVAIIDYNKFKSEVEAELWAKLKTEADKLITIRKYYTIKEVAEIFKVKEKTIDNWHKCGKLCYGQVFGGGKKLFCIREVEALFELLKIERDKRYNNI
ncbi:MAG: helix-turn-helix domain-containing protein [Bacteroidales bacterium]|nr:helix-turn-helix domain-containing protein [Bacteroidales bacterium]